MLVKCFAVAALAILHINQIFGAKKNECFKICTIITKCTRGVDKNDDTKCRDNKEQQNVAPIKCKVSCNGDYNSNIYKNNIKEKFDKKHPTSKPLDIKSIVDSIVDKGFNDIGENMLSSNHDWMKSDVHGDTGRYNHWTRFEDFHDNFKEEDKIADEDIDDEDDVGDDEDDDDVDDENDIDDDDSGDENVINLNLPDDLSKIMAQILSNGAGIEKTNHKKKKTKDPLNLINNIVKFIQ